MNPDPESQQIILQLILIVVLTMLNAFFASAEMALVSLNKNRVKSQAETGDKKAVMLAKLVDDPSKFLATIQVGITLAGFFSSASAATSIATRLESVFGGSSFAKELSIIVVTIVLSYITLVFGELYPKRLALQKSEKIARVSVRPIMAVGVVLRPFVKFLSFSTDILVKLTRMEKNTDNEKMTREEMQLLIETGRRDGVIEVEELQMLRGVFEMDNKYAREVMVPRTDAFMVDAETESEELCDALLSENFSRVPVYIDNQDSVLGILHMKDFFAEARKSGFENIDVKSLVKDAYFAQETMFIDDLLKNMQRTRNQMAILMDEYGGVAGIITVEDLLEEIVGEIDDENDVFSDEVKKINDTTFIVEGRMTLDDFNKMFHVELPSRGVDTVAGFVLTLTGTIPEEDDKVVVEYGTLRFTVEEMNDARLVSVRVEKDIQTNELGQMA
ncbi:HlyC/CorC family transporter [Listeria welshimeri]|uniref:CBS domain protein n=1 Tax=Listeria welshimeri serovar 6b (strain ATCC 35897 / DSM 20650 / CCUG 15529 / CIP 8149 / NCTC 11857 / SLCC 5334 / V8) TaxID=386043 RepID=A0AM72_LISW6|nr:hemolysin family protein [Listeria welshimeri]MBC1248978.1 HlyC/CorC family transporter [Listeria welshimeri]MBC1288473.1 HlyC/CorC family transporter [Listeria welshimeri]MBC1319656.1 HlyC/CorC family transporter [Listeria welshimeri]MBC1343776.1 HlyC/CorC family transporter [Listeria welshimeri]MBC1364668.1 HlyC/CorC family transporter [Listeria welshimeri]